MQDSESIFDGTAQLMPSVPIGAVARFISEGAVAVPVRHLSGYGEFAVFAKARGESPIVLASDLARLIAFVQASATDLATSASLRSAAEVFLGNVIARLRLEARWQVWDGGPNLVGNQRIQFGPASIVALLVRGDPGEGEELAEVLRDWEVTPDLIAESLEPLPQPIPLADGKPANARPHLPEAVFRDDRGNAIHYGERWGASGPPRDSYSAKSHFARFAPLHSIADALVDYLVREYDVTVNWDIAHFAELLRPRDDAVRAIRLAPADLGAAPLTIVYTAYPGIIVHAGELHDFAYPNCGCDACDETVPVEAARLESMVLSGVAGGYVEKYPVGRDRWVGYALVAADGSGNESGQGEVGLIPEPRLIEAAHALESIPAGWQPWPRRGGRDPLPQQSDSDLTPK
jgi:hypothetical protein